MGSIFALSVATVILAASDWPNPLDRLLLVAFLVITVALPVFGYWLTAMDIRAYLRSLRGMLVRIAQPHGANTLPSWLRDETPPCLRALGLTWPCTEDDVKQAYRQLAKELHPDRGGNVRHFLALQSHLSQAHHFLNQQRDSN